MNRSPLVKTFNPFGEMAFVDPPLATDFESRQLFALDHTLRGSLGYLQHGSGLFKSQTPQWLVEVILRRSFHAFEIEQRQCHDASKSSRPFLGKRSRAAFRLVRQEWISHRKGDHEQAQKQTDQVD